MKYKIINKKKRYATILLDAIGYIFFTGFKQVRSHAEVGRKIKKILIIRTAYVGDLVMTLPILKPLKQRFPDADISIVTSREAAVLLDGNPYVDTVYRYNPFWFYRSALKEYFQFIRRLRRQRFDLLIEARGDIREICLIAGPAKSDIKLSYGFGGGAYLLNRVVPFRGIKHRIEYHLDLVRDLGCNTDPFDWQIYIGRREKDYVSKVLAEKGVNGPFVVGHPGARLPLKRWPAHKFAALYDRIIEACHMPVILLGAKDEKKLVDHIASKMTCPAVNLAGYFNLRELAAVLSEARLSICNDSAPMHISAAMKTPTVAIFGPSKSVETRPYGDGHRVVEKDFACRRLCDESRCRHALYNACLKAVEIDDVFNAVGDLLTQSRSSTNSQGF